jgi:hypothetical protein
MPLITTNNRKETGRNNNITQIDPPLSIRRLFQHNPTLLGIFLAPVRSTGYASRKIWLKRNRKIAASATPDLISTLSGIKTRVLGQLHIFVSEVYYEKEFDNLSESIFERYKSDVDTLIYEHCGDVLEKIPAVMDRLAEGDQEAVSQGLTTCRRIIESFADAIYPPTDETIEIGGNTLKLDASRHQNRINAYIFHRTTSKSVRERLRQNLGNLFDRVFSGVHNDVSADEARSLFLNTYLFLGEILHLSRVAA